VSEFSQVVGLVWGYIIQQFSQTVYILGAGFVLACLVSFFFFLLRKKQKKIRAEFELKLGLIRR
jgi:Microsomal signal peptidase 12 kDa subunit (SPC12)